MPTEYYLSSFSLIFKKNSAEQIKMVNKFSVIGCKTNYKGHEKGTGFPLPTERNKGSSGLSFFIVRIHILWRIYSFATIKHFAENLVKKTPKRVKLIHNLKRVPNIITKSQNPVSHPRSSCSPTKYQEWKKTTQRMTIQSGRT